jgi:hypothetical protein
MVPLSAWALMRRTISFYRRRLRPRARLPRLRAGRRK